MKKGTMKNTKTFQISFLPSIMMEDFLSEKHIFVNANDETEAKKKATQIIEKDEDGEFYRTNEPMILA